MLAWNIEAALDSKYVEAVYVSTDDAEIAEVARTYGAHVIDRPAEIAGDAASSESALIQGLDALAEQGVEPDLLVFMQCTSPLTATEDVDAAVQKLLDQKADSCLTATDFHYFVWKENADGSVEGINHDKRFRPRRQDRGPQYQENGAIYVMKVPGFIEANHRFFGKTVMSVMPAERCFEIDEPADLKIAEAMLRARKGELSASSSELLASDEMKENGCQLMANGSVPRAVLFDFDGVFTNNKVYVDENGTESVRCDRSDGWGLAQLKKSGIKIAVLSTEVNPVVTARCKKLGLECRQGLGEKKFEAFINWCAENEIAPEDTIFVGNDANDAECLKAAGCGVVPADAYPEAVLVADRIMRKNGGEGAVRELCEIVMKEGR